MQARAILAIVLVCTVIDQAIKFWVESTMMMHERIDILPFLALFRVHNFGVAFSMFSGLERWFLVGLTGVIVVFVLHLLSRTPPDQWLARLGFALVLGGAAGNLIDRVWLGYVVDYVLFHTPVWSFAVFNLADVFITVGAGLVILHEVVAWRRARGKA